MIDDGNLLNAPDCTIWGAGLLCEVLTLDIGECVFLERNAGKAALLRAIVHKAIFANVEIAGPRAASPLVGYSAREIFLKPVKAAVAGFAVCLDFAIDLFFAAIERFHRAVAVVNDTQRACKTKLDRAMGNGQCVFGIFDSATDHRIDVHGEFRVIGKILQFLIEHFQTLHRNLVRLNVIDADLQMLEAGLV